MDTNLFYIHKNSSVYGTVYSFRAVLGIRALDIGNTK